MTLPMTTKTKFIIILVAQASLCIVFLTFALYQKAEADHQKEASVLSKKIAQKLQEQLHQCEEEQLK
jgi:hypothetical protein